MQRILLRKASCADGVLSVFIPRILGILFLLVVSIHIPSFRTSLRTFAFCVRTNIIVHLCSFYSAYASPLFRSYIYILRFTNKWTQMALLTDLNVYVTTHLSVVYCIQL